MQMINMMPQSVKEAYYSSMEIGRKNGWGYQGILADFRSKSPAASKFFDSIKKGKGDIWDLMNFIQSETGLFPGGEGDLFHYNGTGYGLNAAAMDEFGPGGKYEAYAQYWKFRC